MDILDLMQRSLDKTNDPDAIFALDRGITEIERLREENQRQREGIMLLNSLVQTEHEIIRVDALKEKE